MVHNFVKKPKNYLTKPQVILRNYNLISQTKIKQKCLLGMQVGVFCQNLGITAYALENYSNFKNKFLFNNACQYSSNKMIITITEAGEM